MLVVDGSFEEQIEELATFIDSLSTNDTKVQESVQRCIENGEQETAIKEIVDTCAVLNEAPEKSFESSHNLLIHILLSSQDLSSYLPTILVNFKRLPSQSTGANTSYNILSTLFNVSPTDYRLPVFKALLELAIEHNLYDSIAPKLKDVPSSLRDWNATPEDSRSVYELVADLCEKSNGEARATEYLIRAIQTFKPEDDSRALTIRAMNAAINEQDRFTVDDLLALASVKALESTSPEHYKLLNIIASGDYSDFSSFTESNQDFYTSNSISQQNFDHKMKIITIAALAARQDNRKLRYADVQHALQISEDKVEMWIIEAIKSGLVEGKLSQPASIFIVHRASYRSFEEEQWEEVSAKLTSWRESLQGILQVIDNVKNDISGGQQLTNGFAGSEVDDEEVRSQSDEDVTSVDETAD